MSSYGHYGPDGKGHSLEEIRAERIAVLKIPLSLQEQIDNRTVGHQYAYELLRDAVRKHRDQKADDRCWMDDLELYSILGEAVPADNSVGDKFAMLKNCSRFIEQRCTEGIWPTYAQLEKRIVKLADAMRLLLSANGRRSGAEGYSIWWTDMQTGVEAEQNARTVLDE